MVRHRRALAPLLRPLILTVQVRTRVIDDVLRAFLADHADAESAQIVLLGAGYDCRAARFPAARIFEVDHPATQAHKRALLVDGTAARYLAFDFASQPLDALAPALAALGHDAARPSLVIWEGVTMYLREEAVDATVRALAGLCAPSSTFLFTYLTADAIRPRGLLARAVLRLVLGKVEPLVFGFDPARVGAWLEERGFRAALDRSIPALAEGLLPPGYAPLVAGARTQHVVVARRV